MVDRFLAWLGAGMVIAGVAAAMVAGAAVASADSPPSSDSKGTTSSESAKPTENKADSDGDDASTPNPKPAGEEPKDDATADPEGVEDETTDDTEPPVEQPDQEPTAVKDSDTAEMLATKPVKPVAKEPKPAAKPTAEQEAEQETEEPTESTASTETPVEPVAAVVPIARKDKTAVTPEITAVAFAAPANAEITSTAAAPPLSGLISAIGTIVFNLYGLATRLVGGPPMLPPNSSVTVHSSTLRLDCADGYDVPADTSRPPPNHRRG
jgi:hypothetical protein